MVPAHSIKVSRVLMYSGFCYVFLDFVYEAFTLFRRSFQYRSTTLKESRMQSEPHSARTVVWALTISLAATLVIEFSFFSYCYLDVSVHSVPLHRLCIYLWIHELSSCRFPHSDIPGSKVICTSPRLFAAYHVLRRRLVPRHPPYALCSLIYITFWIS